jgi:hypothetical protein
VLVAVLALLGTRHVASLAGLGPLAALIGAGRRGVQDPPVVKA